MKYGEGGKRGVGGVGGGGGWGREKYHLTVSADDDNEEFLFRDCAPWLRSVARVEFSIDKCVIFSCGEIN